MIFAYQKRRYCLTPVLGVFLLTNAIKAGKSTPQKLKFTKLARNVFVFSSFLWLCAILPELGTRSFFLGSLSAQFLPMDRYCSIAHFADFQVHSSLNRSLKGKWFALGKDR